MLERLAPMWSFALIGGSAVALVLLILAALSRHRNKKTIAALNAALRDVGQGKFDVEVKQTARGELGELVRAFNETTHTLSESRDRLNSYQRSLEERVNERTRELNTATARVIQVAQTDALTSLPNRVLFTRRLEEALKRASKDTTRVVVLFIDLDFFKTVNDSHGHEAGDALLRSVAERLKAAMRPEDLVARFGGDEFIVSLSRLEFQSAETVATEAAQRLLEILAESYLIAGARISINASIGMATYPIDARTAAELIKHADLAMHSAKQAGRNQVARFAESSGQKIADRSKIEADIRRGIAAGEFFLVFQPQVEIGSGAPVGLEALMRWRHPTRGVVSPAEFIPVAEQTGLIHELGRRALEMTCTQFKYWQQRDIFPRVSVNVSAKQFEDAQWLDSVREVIEQTGMPARYLDLEITESMLVNDPDRIVAMLAEVNRMGVTLTLDDFGTGYSSLSYLTRLPFHTIKIDRSFINEIELPRQRGIVQAIIAVAHSLNMRVIAEGIESPLQMTILRELGVEEAQGYYMSKPLEVDAIEPWWNTQLAAVGSTLKVNAA
jgi:diguanylate cyclase (GGDEF)-like protein